VNAGTEVLRVRPFESERQKAMFNLAYSYQMILGRTLQVLKKYELNDQHYNILKILQEADPAQLLIGEVKKQLMDKRGDLSRLIDKLVRRNLVLRETNVENRREVLVVISWEGVALIVDIDRQLREERDTKIGLSEPEAKQLNTLLDKLRG
jgi:DNA-binding MarR family transcriptional regulator